jgi:thiamine kinase-like enzyme
MPNKQEHQQEVRGFLQKHFSLRDCTFSLPRGSGMETYFAQDGRQDYFIKVGAPLERYLAMAEIGLTPPVLAYGQLESGQSILVQPFIAGRTPTRSDLQDRLDAVAALIHQMHHHPQIQGTLEAAPSSLQQAAGLRALDQLRQKWERHKPLVPAMAELIDQSLERLTRQVSLFSGAGLVASHNDICNANWLFASGGQIYVIDFESMSMDDPAFDLGALSWWYYPPEMRGRFLEGAGYRYDDEFKLRMQVRMAMHCLNIILPREQSFDSFDPADFEESLEDFRAILEGRENPQGYD